METSRTSEGTLLSSLHGAQRREQRGISKPDLRSAKKHGAKERTYGYNGKPRWKFTFRDIVYITEDDEVTEVTSYVRPLEITKAVVTKKDELAHQALIRRFQSNPNMITSHTVVVIDQSASMRTCDVDNYKTRSDAVFASVAVDYIAHQIDNRHLSNVQYTDVMTLIEMNETSQVIFEREPCTNVLYNKVLFRKEIVRPRSHGMFKGALDLALEVLMEGGSHSSCPLQLMFLSDGRPSDCIHDPEYDAGQQIFDLCTYLKSRLTVVTLGFAKSGSDFTVLERMAECATIAGSQGSFKAVDLRGNDLSSTVENLSNTMSQTRQSSLLHRNYRPRTIRTVAAEPKPAADYNFEVDEDKVSVDKWDIYRDGCNIFAWRDRRLQAVNSVDGVAINKAKMGEGAERIVFRLKELVKEGGRLCVERDRFVAKECKYLEDVAKQHKFHEKFCKTQAQATKLAEKFNASVQRCCRITNINVDAAIQFLSCFVYQVPEPNEDGKYRYILVEKRLDPTKYMKWNSNNGFVRTQHSVSDIMLGRNTPTKKAVPLLTIAEGSDEERSEYGEENEANDIRHRRHLLGAKLNGTAHYTIKLEDYPQAFSHFTYRYSQREKLVCDLQGVLDSSVSPAVFELTDPVIHFNNTRRRKVYGRTDHGAKGMNKFFETHVCNDLCRLLGFTEYV